MIGPPSSERLLRSMLGVIMIFFARDEVSPAGIGQCLSHENQYAPGYSIFVGERFFCGLVLEAYF